MSARVRTARAGAPKASPFLQRSRADGELAGFIGRRSQVRILPPLLNGRDRRGRGPYAEVHRRVANPKSRSALRQWAPGLHHTPPREQAGPSAETRRKLEQGHEPPASGFVYPAVFVRLVHRTPGQTSVGARHHRRERSGVGTPGGIRLLLEGGPATARPRGRSLWHPSQAGRRPGVVPGRHSVVRGSAKQGSRRALKVGGQLRNSSGGIRAPWGAVRVIRPISVVVPPTPSSRVDAVRCSSPDHHPFSFSRGDIDV